MALTASEICMHDLFAFTLYPEVKSVVGTCVIGNRECPLIFFEYGEKFTSFWQQSELHTGYAIGFEEGSDRFVYTVVGNGLIRAVPHEIHARCASSDPDIARAGNAEMEQIKQTAIFAQHIHVTPTQHQSFQACLAREQQILMIVNTIHAVMIAIAHPSGLVQAKKCQPRNNIRFLQHACPTARH